RTNDRANAGDRAQAREVLLMLRARFDQRLGSEVKTRDEPIEAPSERLELVGESAQLMQRHFDCFTQRDERGAALDQSINLALLRCGWRPGVQLGVFMGDHPGD